MRIIYLLCVLLLLKISHIAHAGEPLPLPLVDEYNNTVEALYSDPTKLSSAQAQLQKSFDAYSVKDFSDYTDAYVASESLLDRLKRRDQVKAGLAQCNFKKCAPNSKGCVDLGIDKQITEDTKSVEYCEGSSSNTVIDQKNIGAVVTALKSKKAAQEQEVRSPACSLARSAESEFLLNRIKSLMRLNEALQYRFGVC